MTGARAVPDTTYNVFGGMLSLTRSINHWGTCVNKNTHWTYTMDGPGLMVLSKQTGYILPTECQVPTNQ